MAEIIDFLEYYNIAFTERGKNVTSGWVEINCPYCSDPSFHMGINIDTGNFNCWICGESGKFPYFIKSLLDCTWAEAKKISLQYSGVSSVEIIENLEYSEKIQLPKVLDEIPSSYLDVLRERNFNPSYIIKKYKLMACGITGEWKFRFIVPFYLDGKLVTFSSMDATGKQEPKYKHCHNEGSVVPIKKTLYNIDNIKDKAVIVEGITDVWRGGSNFIGLMGKNISDSQINLVYAKGINHVIILLDSDAHEEAEKVANKLSGVIKKVEIIYLEEGDPADMSESDLREVLR